MNCDHCPVPTSVVRSSNSRIATYETRVFLTYNATWLGPDRSVTSGSGRGKSLLLTFVAAVSVIAALLLGVAAAKADPASTSNQATILRFTNKVELGAVQPASARAKVDHAFAKFSAIRNPDIFNVRQSFFADTNLAKENKVNKVLSIVHAHLP